MIGKIIGNYRIVRELGVGGMGAVYEGVDVMVERTVAVKMLRAEIARQPDLIERFRVEAVTLAKLGHPCIATLYSFFREGEDSYMVMEFVRGRTLEDILKETGRLAPEQGAGILQQTLDGMAHAHRMGVLHRDIKPANIMISGDGKVKVTDFGIARVLGSERMTREGKIIGTLEYLAPERIRGEEADIRSDLYSAGIVLFEMLAGRLPFVSDTDYGLMQAHLNKMPPSLVELGANCPPELEVAVRRALAKSPQERFQSAEQFRSALAAAVPNSAPWSEMNPAVPASSIKPTRLAGAEPALPQTRLAGGAYVVSDLKPPQKMPLKWLIVAAVLIIMAGFITWIRMQREVSPQIAFSPPGVVPEPAQPASSAKPLEIPPVRPVEVAPPTSLRQPGSSPLVSGEKKLMLKDALGEKEAKSSEKEDKSGAPATIRAVRKLYIERMSNHLDQYIKSEIARQLPDRLIVVSDKTEADAVMRGRGEEIRGSMGAKVTGGFLGMKDEAFGQVSITDLEGNGVLWRAEAGDRMPILGAVKHGGQKKVAERLVSSLKKAMRKN